MLRISTVNAVNVMEVRLPDGIDSTEFDQLNERLSTVLGAGAGSRWVLDLSGVEYLGSAALGLLVNIRQHIKAAQGRLALCHLSVPLTKIFKTCCLEQLFVIARTMEEAMKAVK